MGGNAGWWTAGVVVGTANTIRHRVRGYRTPRVFSSTDWDRAEAYAHKVIDRWVEQSGIEFAGKRILEVGPGPDLATGALMLQAGASSYDAVDRFPLAAEVPAAFYDRFDVDPATLGYHVDRFPDLPSLSGPFDLIVSNSCLEHIEDIPGLFLRLSRLSAPSGQMVHHVDAKAHTRWFTQRDPLNPHRYSDGLYKRLLWFPGAPNRLLALDYRRAAEAAGWTVQVVPRTLAPAGYLGNVHLAPRFRAHPDLHLLSFTLICQH